MTKNNKNDEKITEFIGKSTFYILKGIKFAGISMYKVTLGALKKLRYFKKTDMYYITAPVTTSLFLIRLGFNNIKTISILSITAFIISLGTAFLIEKKQFLKAIDKCNLKSTNHKPLIYHHSRAENLTKIYSIGLSIPSAKIKMNISKLNNSLKTNIVDIRRRHFLKWQTLEIVTSKYEDTNSTLLREQLIYNILFKLIEDVEIIDFEDIETQQTIYFNTETFYKKVIALKEEFAHRLKENEKNINLMTCKDFTSDYKLTIKIPFDETLTFKEVLAINKDKLKKLRIPYILGYTDHKELKIIDLYDVVHLIIAGATGQGKTNCMHNLILSILFNDKPLRFILCDPKMNEFKMYRTMNNIEYYDNLEDIANIVSEIFELSEERNRIIKKYDDIRDIDGYNQKFPNSPMDEVVLIIDEIADLMLNPDKELKETFKNNLDRICGKSRSTGIRVILSTQNPIKDVIPGCIKSNIVNRIGLATSNGTDSRTIIDDIRCKDIEQKGKFIFKKSKYLTPMKAIFIDDDELFNIIDHLKQHSINFRVIKDEKISEDSNIKVLPGGENLKIGDEKKIEKVERVIIKNSKELFNFYKSLNLENDILPAKKEILNLTNLTDYYLREYHKQLKENHLIKNIENNQIKLLTNEIEYQKLKRNEELKNVK